MISYIEGKIKERDTAALVILAGGLGYEVLVPAAVLGALPEATVGQEVSLVIYYFLQIDQARATPVMIGFRNALEREFFENFTRVAGIGPRTAVKAIAQPIPKIAGAIERGDAHFLTTLPGIGRQKAKEIIAKLQGKMTPYFLLDAGDAAPEAVPATPAKELEEEVLTILLQLGYNRADALQMITRALASEPVPTTTEEMLSLIYRQGKS
ncbi:MAG TPA: OB-fold domain-containing protein [Armatimonadota bacterium]|nr:OB-fold domain-containing protein [Armatimonadota bacterium]HOS43324.1 OB-fold domain-containing protein [Armatimonadota bacterium]